MIDSMFIATLGMMMFLMVMIMSLMTHKTTASICSIVTEFSKSSLAKR